MDSFEICEAVALCDAWLDTMHGPGGYGGPVAHWWQNCLQFTGAGLDWRYEGIILGYLNLHRVTTEDRWLAKARRAGDDLLHGQLFSSNYRNSSFEQNPYTGGTPHEAACDLALVHLASALREAGSPEWRGYLDAAEGNLRRHYVGHLWDDDSGGFRDHLQMRSFVPNKAATLVEALLALASVSGDQAWADRYARPTLDGILEHQQVGGPLDGAIHQSSLDGRLDGRFFPYYIARCIPALVGGYELFAEERFLNAGLRAIGFVLRYQYTDGSFPQVVYPGRQVNRYPQWIAAVGDILRAIDLLRPYGLTAKGELTLAWLLDGQESAGAFRTAKGFASQVSQRDPGDLPEFRDLLPVVGWNDKAFRYLASLVERTVSPVTEPPAFEADCIVRGQRMRLRETAEELVVSTGDRVRYHWRKGEPWPRVVGDEFRLQ